MGKRTMVNVVYDAGSLVWGCAPWSLLCRTQVTKFFDDENTRRGSEECVWQAKWRNLSGRAEGTALGAWHGPADGALEGIPDAPAAAGAQREN